MFLVFLSRISKYIYLSFFVVCYVIVDVIRVLIHLILKRHMHYDTKYEVLLHCQESIEF